MNEETQVENPQTPAVEEPKKGGPRRTVLMIVAAIAVVFVAYKAVGGYIYGLSHIETDNAYVTGDLVGISPTVAGTLVELKVKDGDFVKKGQLIARLDTAGAQAELEQAEANYQAALTQVPQAESALEFEKLSTQAAIQHSEATLATENAKTSGSRLQVRLSADTVTNTVKQAESAVLQAEAQEAQSKAGIANAQAALGSAKQGIETAQRTANAQSAMVGAAKADAERAATDLERYKKLLATEAISRQQYDTAFANAASAKSNLESAQERAEAAISGVAQARANVTQAQAELVASQRQADASAKQVEVAKSALDLAKSRSTEVGIQNANVRTSLGETSKANADVATAQAGSQEVALREKQISTARAQVAQAKAAVARANVQVRDANLYAPCDGYVVKHTVNVGTAINPGQNVVTITRGNDIWVMANFKETQLSTFQPGQPAEIAVDAYPGKTFHGHVESILRATGSATTLLPPDNSTGNFTKVVQRVPVRITIDPSEGSDEIRQGMSVIATIDTSRKHE